MPLEPPIYSVQTLNEKYLDIRTYQSKSVNFPDIQYFPKPFKLPPFEHSNDIGSVSFLKQKLFQMIQFHPIN